jgi:16S rRNA processing protein RimM
VTAHGRRLVTVGRVGRPHGREGAFVVELASDHPDRFAVGRRVLVDGEPATVVESKLAGGRRVLRLDTRARRGADLCIPAAELPPPGDGSYYVFQLVGLTVEDENGVELGRVQDVVPGVANDVVELDTGLSFPFVEDWVPVVDLETGRMVIRAGRLRN